MMKKLLLIASMFVCALASAQSTMTITSTTISNLQGTQLASGQACLLATDNAGNAISLQAAGGGQIEHVAGCVTVTSGVMTITAPNTAATNPSNPCLALTVTDTGSGPTYGQTVLDKGYECLQPSPSAYWCNSTTNVCNLDNFIPSGMSGMAVVAGPQGPTGAPGTPLTFLGTFASAPSNPAIDNAYRDSTLGQTRVWTGSAWTEMNQDGATGATGPAVPLASTTPLSDGTASAGSSTTAARADHVHPSDTSRVPTATTVNGHALSANVVISASDLTTGTLPHAQLPTLVSGDIPANAANTSGNAATATALQTAPTFASGNGTCSWTGTWPAMTITCTGGYTLPAATSTSLGGVKPDGTTISNSSGAIAVTYGTAASTAAQGNDSRITGALSATTAASTYVPQTQTVNGHALSGAVVVSASDITTGTLPASQIPAATTSALGGVKPDGTTISNSSGAISCTTATSSQLGCVKPDGTTVTISSGVISATGSGLGGTSLTTLYSNATTTNTAILALPTAAANATLRGQCKFIWEVNSTSDSMVLSVGASATPTGLYLMNTASTGTNGATTTESYMTITSTTTTAITGLVPTSASIAYLDVVDFVLVNGSSANTITFYAHSLSASYIAYVEPGSYCTWLP
jgi:hypothetical protein